MAYRSLGFAEAMLRPPPLPRKPPPRPSLQWLQRHRELEEGLAPPPEAGELPVPVSLPRGGLLQEDLPMRATPEEKLAQDIERTKALEAARWEARAPEREYEERLAAEELEREQAEEKAARIAKTRAAAEREFATQEKGEAEALQRHRAIKAALAEEIAGSGATWTPTDAELTEAAKVWEQRGQTAEDVYATYARERKRQAPQETAEERLKRIRAESKARAEGTAAGKPPAEPEPPKPFSKDRVQIEAKRAEEDPGYLAELDRTAEAGSERAAQIVAEVERRKKQREPTKWTGPFRKY